MKVPAISVPLTNLEFREGSITPLKNAKNGFDEGTSYFHEKSLYLSKAPAQSSNAMLIKLKNRTGAVEVSIFPNSCNFSFEKVI